MKPKKWWERRDPKNLPKDVKVPGGIMRTIRVKDKNIPIFIPIQAFEMDPINWEMFMGINQLLSRWAARKFPNEPDVARAYATSMASWVNPPDARKFLETTLASGRIKNKEKQLAKSQIKVLKEIERVFGSELDLSDVAQRDDFQDIILEMWDKFPPTLVPESCLRLSGEERSRKIDQIMEYTMFLHENFKSVHPMIRAEVASMCGEHTAKKMMSQATDEVKALVEAIAKRYESN